MDGDRLICTDVRKNGSRCSAAPVLGASKCEEHGGLKMRKNPERVARYADRLVGRCEALMMRRGIHLGEEERMEILSNPRQVDPGVLLLEEIARTAGVVGWLEKRVQSLREDEEFIAKVEIETVETGTSATGNHMDMAKTETRREVSVWWELLSRERDHLVKVTTAALRAGVEERAVRLAERSVDALEAALSGALEQLGHDPNSSTVRAVIGAALQRALTATPNDAQHAIVPGVIREPDLYEEPVRPIEF